MCSNFFCRHKQCNGACGNSLNNKLILGENGNKSYIKARDIILDDYLNICTNSKISIKGKEKLFDYEIFIEISQFDNLEEAYKNLRNIKLITKKLKEYIN